jgi:hypothetical protein
MVEGCFWGRSDLLGLTSLNERNQGMDLRRRPQWAQLRRGRIHETGPSPPAGIFGGV